MVDATKKFNNISDYTDCARRGLDRDETSKELGVSRQRISIVASKYNIVFVGSKYLAAIRSDIRKLHKLADGTRTAKEISTILNKSVRWIKEKNTDGVFLRPPYVGEVALRHASACGKTLTESAAEAGLLVQDAWSMAKRLNLKFAKKGDRK